MQRIFSAAMSGDAITLGRGAPIDPLRRVQAPPLQGIYEVAEARSREIAHHEADGIATGEPVDDDASPCNIPRMTIVSLTDVIVGYGPQEVLRGATLQLVAGARMG